MCIRDRGLGLGLGLGLWLGEAARVPPYEGRPSRTLPAVLAQVRRRDESSAEGCAWLGLELGLGLEVRAGARVGARVGVGAR
eukprot:scaffold86112_cov15-Phaeocystis_antarctica.AAC.1